MNVAMEFLPTVSPLFATTVHFLHTVSRKNYTIHRRNSLIAIFSLAISPLESVLYGIKYFVARKLLCKLRRSEILRTALSATARTRW